MILQHLSRPGRWRYSGPHCKNSQCGPAVKRRRSVCQRTRLRPSSTPCRSALSGQYFWRTGLGAILQGAEWDDNIPSYPCFYRQTDTTCAAQLRYPVLLLVGSLKYPSRMGKRFREKTMGYQSGRPKGENTEIPPQRCGDTGRFRRLSGRDTSIRPRIGAYHQETRRDRRIGQHRYRRQRRSRHSGLSAGQMQFIQLWDTCTAHYTLSSHGQGRTHH